MSTKITTRVWDHSQHRSTTLTVLLAIADMAHDNGVAWPGADMLAAKARTGKRAIYTHLEKLEQSGELAVYRRQGIHNVYVVTLAQTDADRRDAEKMIEDLFCGATASASPQTTGDQTITGLSNHVHTGEKTDEEQPTGDQAITSTPDQAITSDHVITGDQTITTTGDQTITTPVIERSPPGDQAITRSNTVVVVESHIDSDSDIQQQQRDATPPPCDTPPPPREPHEAERKLFIAQKIPPRIWRPWMAKDSETVIAVILHATESNNVQNPVGLMRAMLERSAGTPLPKYHQMAQQRLAGEPDDPYADVYYDPDNAAQRIRRQGVPDETPEPGGVSNALREAWDDALRNSRISRSDYERARNTRLIAFDGDILLIDDSERELLEERLDILRRLLWAMSRIRVSAVRIVEKAGVA